MPPTTVEAAIQLALEHHQAGRLAEAEAIYRWILAQYPDHADALHLLGVLACQTGHPDAAIELIDRAIAVNPAMGEYHINRGNALKAAGRLDDATDAYRRAILLSPGSAAAYSNLGNALWEQGRLDEALDACRRAVALKPDLADAHINLGNVLKDQQRFEEAIEAYRRAVALDPAYAVAHNNLGNALMDQGQLDEAIAAFHQAIQLSPSYATALNNLGSALTEQARIDEALACFRQAIALQPDLASAASNYLLTLHYHPGSDAQALLAEHRQWAQRYAEPLANEIRPHLNDRAPERKLRVGYLSADFRTHPVARLLLPLFANHDRSRVAVVAYADTRVPDALTAELQARADEWRVCAGLSDRQLAERIRGDQIDILVDLALHTAGNRMLVFARKPAPLQITMLGMPATTGLTTMDYRLTDPYLDPPGTNDGDYTEQSIRLPHCYWCYQPPIEAPGTGVLPALQAGFITFGCLNQFMKVNRRVLELWVRILAALRDSRLVLLSHPGSHLEAARRVFEAAGIAGDRIGFAARADRRAYFERLAELDLALDPFPYNGHTSTLDALYMGVPVVTLASGTAVGRAGVSILSNAGLPELIARTPDEYVAIALAWAGDLDRLSKLRAGLRQRMQRSPLMDAKQYAVDVEAVFRQVWNTWCRS